MQWVHPLTAHPSTNLATYFRQNSLTPDGRTIVFVSNREGGWQLFAVPEFPHRDIVQLTGGAPLHPSSPAIDPAGERVFFARDGGLSGLSLATLEERCVVDYGTASIGECLLDPAGRWLVAACKQGENSGLPVGRTDGADWRWIPFPRTVIHPQFHQADPEWLLFAGPPAPHMHRVRQDGTGLECLSPNDDEEFAVHETFLGATGRVTDTVWPPELRVVDWQTPEPRTIAWFNVCHITPNPAGRAC